MAHSMRILIVDDDPVSRLLLERMLQSTGTCDFAANGREAVEAYGEALEAEDPYALVCMDVIMPELDGLAALAAIRAREDAIALPPSRAAKIVMTTVLRNPENVTDAYRCHCDGYLFKPISRDKLTGLLMDLGFLEHDNRTP